MDGAKRVVDWMRLRNTISLGLKRLSIGEQRDTPGINRRRAIRLVGRHSRFRRMNEEVDGVEGFDDVSHFEGSYLFNDEQTHLDLLPRIGDPSHHEEPSSDTQMMQWRQQVEHLLHQDEASGVIHERHKVPEVL